MSPLTSHARGRPSLQSLDDALLLKVLGALPLRERLCSAALVCRRWRDLSCNSPELFAELDVCLAAGGSVLPRLRALLSWLLRHAGAPIRSAKLCLWQDGFGFGAAGGSALAAAGGAGQAGGPVARPPTPPASSESAAEIVALLNSCVIACPSVERLTISHSTTYIPNGWTVALRGLRHLRLVSRSRIHLLTTLEGLTALQVLELCAPSIVLAPAAALPPSVTSLTVAGDRGPHLPHQLGELSSLRSLHLRSVAYDSGGFEVLRQMPALRSLHLDRCRLPACLAALPGLQSLSLCAVVGRHGEGTEDGDVPAGVDTALRRLAPQLSSLTLALLPPAAACPPALATLRNLQSLTVLPAAGQSAAAAAGAGAAVPAWPPALCRLTTTAAVASASVGGLASAGHLHTLCLLDAPVGGQEHLTVDFWSWAEDHRPLRRLEVATWQGLSQEPGPHAAMQDSLRMHFGRLAALRPALCTLQSSAQSALQQALEPDAEAEGESAPAPA